jgi:methyl-accepting chemotaxis protein
MPWMRRVSLVNRIRFLLVVMLLGALSVGGAAAWWLHSQATTLQALAANSTDVAQTAKQLLELSQSSSSAAASLLGFVAITLAASVVLGMLVTGSIRESVESTVQCVIGIAGGDLETKIESPGKDEISWLRSELNGMRKNLRRTVLEVRQTVDSVNTASDEIASGNGDLSARTESQASALQQTASAMQQLAGTVKQNAQSANEARTMVSQSSDVAHRGAKTMQAVIGRMGEINASATRISEIIGVIDGIAFQTNILALNAAVEAARAGDHGRGFAVVASEVRGLAHRSSTAAREIKALIEDSTAKVESGSNMVDEAGRTMSELLDRVTRISALISNIAQAGESQHNGIDQVRQAIEQIDTMTQQNAALVEQLAAAAQGLRGQSSQLNTSMSGFRVAS